MQRPMVRRPSGLTDGLSTLRWMCHRGCRGMNWWVSRYVGEGVEGAGDSPFRLIILHGRSAEYRSGILVFAAIFHQQAGLNLINGEK